MPPPSASTPAPNLAFITLAHELRNPSSAILGAAALLQRMAIADEPMRRVASIIATQAHHISRLIEDVIQGERLNRGKVILDSGLVDLRNIVSDTVDTYRRHIKHRRQVLTVEPDLVPVYVRGDAVRLAQIVSNLVDNASKYTPPLGRIAVTVSSEGADGVIEVRDTGVGIAAEYVSRIFEPFAQIQEIGFGPKGGLGLGLAVVRTAAELHGGTVSVRSEGPGGGSCFTVRLPLAVNPDAGSRTGAEQRSGMQPAHARFPSCVPSEARDSLLA
jgi:signal transduction histidine kinase